MVSWEGTIVLTTPRLLLRTFRLDDLPAYAAINADPEVMRYIGGPMTKHDSDEIAEWAQQCYDDEGIGLLAIERREDGRFLGMTGVSHEDWYPDDIQLGWRLAREHWGHGYATEAASAWLGHALGHLGYRRVLAVADVPNLRSRRVMERLGMSIDHEADLVIDGASVSAVIYVMSAHDWAVRDTPTA
jgi:RimJ/RimL family protein N-acetyltransferase